MSVLETFFWDVLDHAAMPLVFLLGFVGISAGACLVLMWLDKRRR
ncbi:MAG: TIGR02808 family protein [Oceanisphaera sp.]|nr:TIGR02808 family protein [Gammaproteobacteria bacterium]MDX1266690.1 TIGR02808 family protein [Oceanisphaera sp.]